MNKFAGNRRDQEQRRWKDFWWRKFCHFLTSERETGRHGQPIFTSEQVIAFLKLQKDRGKRA